MDTAPTPEGVYRFAGFVLDPARAALAGPDGVAIELRPKSYALLLHLLRHAGRLVTREQLLDAVWPNVTVGDDSITQCVRDIRRALGEPASSLLRTLPRRGYILDVAPGVAPASDPAAADPTTPHPSVQATPSPGWAVPKQWALAALGLLALLLAGVVWQQSQPVAGDPPAAVPPAAGPPAREPTPREVARRLTAEASRLGEFEGGRAIWLRQRELFARATEMDPGHAPAWIGLSFTYSSMLASGFSLNPAADQRAAEAAAERGLALAPDRPDAHAALCAVLRRHPDRLDAALVACRRAVELSPTSHPARANIGWVLIQLGRAEEGIGPLQASIAAARAEHAMQPVWHYFLGTGLLLTGRDEEAVVAFRRALLAWRVDDRGAMVGLIAALALSGQRAEAQVLAAEARQRWPELTVERVRANPPSVNPAFLAQRQRLLDGLTLAGIP